MQQKRSWLFIDLDGTLFDTVSYSKSVFFEFGKSIGVSFTEDDFQACNGPTLKEIARYLKKKYKLNQSIAKLELLHKNKLFKKIPKCKIRPHAKKALKKLRSQGWKCALVTSASNTYIYKLITKNKIRDFFDLIISGDHVQQSKPHPAIYRLAQKQAGKGYFVALEDSDNGIVAAKKAGCITLRFRPNQPQGFFSISSFKDLQNRLYIIDGSPVLAGFPSRFNFKISNTAGSKFPKTTSRSIDDFWNKAKQNHASLYDGRIFILKDEATNYSFTGSFFPYRYIYYQIQKGEFLGLIPCGVTGVVKWRNKFLLLRRSKNVTGSRSLFEFAPSGGIDKSSRAKENNSINPKTQLIRELKEELHIVPEDISSVGFLCFVLDLTDQTLDIIYQASIKATSKPKLSSEHTEMITISPRNLKTLISKNAEYYIPLTKFIVKSNLLTK